MCRPKELSGADGCVDEELHPNEYGKIAAIELIEEIHRALRGLEEIAICDDYSLPVDFVKKRPSSFDPCLAEAIPVNPDTWAAPSPQAEFLPFGDSNQPQQQTLQYSLHSHHFQQTQNQGCPPPPPLPPTPAPLSTLPTLNHNNNNNNNPNNGAVTATIPCASINTLPNPQKQQQTYPGLPSQQLLQQHQHSIPLKHPQQQRNKQTNRHPLHPLHPLHPPLPHAIKHASVKLIEGYSDPKDSKRHKKVYHKKGRRRTHKSQQQQWQKQERQKQNTQTQEEQSQQKPATQSLKDKRSNYSSDSSAPKSSDDEDEDNQSVKVPELNSPDSISDDLVRPLPPQLHRSPRKLTAGPTETSKRNPSPYYYSDLLKSKDQSNVTDKETKNKSRQSTASEPPQLTQPPANVGAYRKSTSLDVPEREERDVAAENEEEDDFEETEHTNTTVFPANETPKRYSFTEEGVHIIRCDSPSTSTSEESDCSECLKRREWHARALALVRKTCNVQPLNAVAGAEPNLQCAQYGGPNNDSPTSMPPHRLLGPSAVCACVAPNIGDDLDEYFRPRSIFYVHPHGVHECADCSPDARNLNASNNTLDLDEGDEDEMSGRTRQLYETAFDCKVAKSDDDLDEVDRVTNHSVLLQLNNGNPIAPKPESRASKSSKSRLEGKRLKNSKNQAIQDLSSNSGGSGSPHTVGGAATSSKPNTSSVELVTELANIHIHDTNTDPQNNTTTTSTSQLPLRGYTPSPPSTAPLPMKFPGKHDRFLMNSIKSAPNLPSSNPAHPRLRDLRLPLQATLRQQQQQCISNDTSLTDSAYANPPSSNSQLTASLASGVGGSRTRGRPRSFVLESGRVLELRKSHASHHHPSHVVGNGGRRPHNYSSTESIATSSSGGSMESLRSSTSEGNRSTSSSESRHSTSLSSHSSESGSSSVAFPLRAPVVIHTKLHILSPISDKSSQEPASEVSEQHKAQAGSPEDAAQKPQTVTTNAEISHRPTVHPQIEALKKRRPPPNKTLLHLADEILGSDSGISLHSREDGKQQTSLQKFTLPKLNFPPSDKANDSGISVAGGMSSSVVLPQDLRDLPFDMPKLRRRKTLQQDACTSGSATSVDLGDLPFDMPKLRRRLRANQVEINNLMVHSTESSGISQASSSHSMRDDNKTALKLDSAIFRQNLTLNLNEPRQPSKFGSLDLRGLSSTKELNLNLAQGYNSAAELIDLSIPLERQGWYHGSITRIEAETTLRPLTEGSFLVRNCESTKQDYSLSLKGAKGFMHMRIQRNESGQYILGQFSRPFDTVSDMIRHFCLNRLPVRGAEHMCLLDPVIAQLL